MNRIGRRQGILMVVENNGFPNDVRVKAEAQALADAGYRVSVISPRRPGQGLRSRVGSIEVFRYPEPPAGGSLAGYVWEYAYSVVASMVLSLVVLVRPGFTIIHAANPPDLFFVLAWCFRPLGKRFVFDHHDLSPELFGARFGAKGPPFVRRALLWAERRTFAAADLVISTNESYRTIAIERGGVDAGRVVVVRNGPDLDRVRRIVPDREIRSKASIVIGYVGVMARQDGVDLLVRAMAHLVHELGRRDVYAAIVGHGDEIDSLRLLAQELEIEDHLEFCGRLVDDALMTVLSAADIFVDPDPSNPYNDRSSMIKMSEYMALERPIVAFDLPEHRVTAGDAAVYAEGNDPRELARAIAELIDSPERREAMGEQGRRRVEEVLAWQHQAKILVQAYESAFGPAAAPDGHRTRSRRGGRSGGLG